MSTLSISSREFLNNFCKPLLNGLFSISREQDFVWRAELEFTHAIILHMKGLINLSEPCLSVIDSQDIFSTQRIKKRVNKDIVKAKNNLYRRAFNRLLKTAQLLEVS